ncbi:MAG: prolyl oligopeptidase family serine peptidase [Chlamydiae bacterium]|nr:prolyl oligopeptidase family serine peptidase [Chlamydiota bacterium]
MTPKISCLELSVAPDLALYHTGPALDLGSLPAVFYLALSGPDSLCTDPYNQPIQFLSGKMIRSFSLTLPAHEAELSPLDALQTWADDFSRGIDCLKPCIDQIQTALEFAIQNRFVDPRKVAIAGLSRGGLVAAFAMAHELRFRYLLSFAPLTKLSDAKEFHSLKDLKLVQSYSAEKLAPLLANRRARLYIGNRDQRVSTRGCFDFAMALVEEAHKAGVRTPPIELIITPSIGREGHGTSPEVFAEGAAWLAECLLHGEKNLDTRVDYV